MEKQFAAKRKQLVLSFKDIFFHTLCSVMHQSWRLRRCYLFSQAQTATRASRGLASGQWRNQYDPPDFLPFNKVLP
jgi:hypothetical protein